MATIEASPGLVVLKRCVDVDDLLAAATSGQADVAVLAIDAPSLEPSAVAHLRRHAVRPVVVSSGPTDDIDTRERALRLDVRSIVSAGDLSGLPAAVREVDGALDTRARAEGAGQGSGVGPEARAETEMPFDDQPAGSEGHRVVAVWGPAGAPGRSTVAVNLAMELALRQRPTVLVDVDPYGGSVAQQLGILDEVSGILSAARLAGSGHLAQRFATTGRGVGAHLGVITGLPRADRWREVRPAHVEQVLDLARSRGEVVVDTGFSLEEDPAVDIGGRPGRNAMTLAALDCADEVVVVGSADPVGLTRLARGLVDLRERLGPTPVRVVVNRMRPSIGWTEKDIAGMVEGFARTAGLHFVPDDRGVVDSALIAGRAGVESRESAFTRAFGGLADALLPSSVPANGKSRGRGRALARMARR